jgi:hypothetical protein
MKRQKVFFNDLLALALAGIVSLLFTHGITQFVNSNKKQEHSPVSVSQPVASEVDTQSEIFKSSRQVNVPEISYHIECSVFVHEKLFKLSRQVTFDIAWDWKRIKLPLTHSAQQYYLKLKEVWDPSIPIALCRLLI